MKLISLEKMWTGLVQAIEAPKLLTDVRFSTRMQRIRTCQMLTSILSVAFRHKHPQEWIKRLTFSDVPHAPVHRIDDVLQDPEMLQSKNSLDLVHPVMGTVDAYTAQFSMTDAGTSGAIRAAYSWERTEDVLNMARMPNRKTSVAIEKESAAHGESQAAMNFRSVS